MFIKYELFFKFYISKSLKNKLHLEIKKTNI